MIPIDPGGGGWVYQKVNSQTWKKSNALLSNSSFDLFPVSAGLIEHVDWQIVSRSLEALRELWTDSSRSESSHYAPLRSDSLLFEAKQILHADHLRLHPGDLGDVSQAPRSVGEARDLEDQAHRGRDLLADGLLRQVQVRHHRHRFNASECITRTVGVNCGHRSVVARVHGLEHVESFLAADFADDDPIGTHAQAVDHQLPREDCSLALCVGRTTFEAHHMPLLQLQLRRVFDGDDSLFCRDVSGKHIE